jgi:NAD(P)-dependent dehydrogenase (short-subunit alcohol dehydrogenase family)
MCIMWQSFVKLIYYTLSHVAYSVSKIGVIGMTRILAHRASRERNDILVNSCCPGWVKTDMAGPAARLTPGTQSKWLYALEHYHELILLLEQIRGQRRRCILLSTKKMCQKRRTENSGKVAKLLHGKAPVNVSRDDALECCCYIMSFWKLVHQQVFGLQ